MLQSQWSMSIRRLERKTTATEGQLMTVARARLNQVECFK
jgi:hypothetical protein